MVRRSLFDRAREFLAGASRRVQEVVSDFFERSNDRDDSEELREIIDFDSGSSEQNQSDDNQTDEQIAERIERSDSPENLFPPEGDPEEGDNPDEEFESEFEFELSSFGIHSPKDLRRVVATFAEALAYARDITLPAEDITIVRDRDTLLFRVLVEYEVMTSE